MAAPISDYPILLGESLDRKVTEFFNEEDIGKPVFVLAYNRENYIKFRGVVTSYGRTS